MSTYTHDDTQPMLSLSEVSVSYGQVKAIMDISIDIKKGEIVSIIGANGAGKTTTLTTITGLVRGHKGYIHYHDGKKQFQLQALKTKTITELGISLVPEGRRIFPRLTVQENLDLGAYTITSKKEVQENLDYVMSLFPILKERRGQMGGTLSGGEQQMLAIARALMASPKLLLLDEPSLGLAPLVIQKIFEVLAHLRQEQKLTILLVEQNVNLALKIADRGYVLETGTISLQGSATSLRENPAVQRAYLGM